jgi:hypothetical protein
MKKIFGKDKPEDLTDGDLQAIIEHPSFEVLATRVMQQMFDRDPEIRQIVIDRVNITLDSLFIKESNIDAIRKSVIRQIDELHNVKILLDRIPHSNVESDRESVINQWTGQRDYDFVNLIVSACRMSRLNSVSPNIADPDASKRIIDEEIEELREEVERRFR